MTDQPKIYVDLLKVDSLRRVKLTAMGTLADLRRHAIELRQGMTLRLYTDDLDAAGKRDDLVVDGIAHFDEVTDSWVAIVDWDKIRHESEISDS